jgi:hypothetical protein
MLHGFSTWIICGNISRELSPTSWRRSIVKSRRVANLTRAAGDPEWRLPGNWRLRTVLLRQRSVSGDGTLLMDTTAMNHGTLWEGWGGAVPLVYSRLWTNFSALSFAWSAHPMRMCSPTPPFPQCPSLSPPVSHSPTDHCVFVLAAINVEVLSVFLPKVWPSPRWSYVSTRGKLLVSFQSKIFGVDGSRKGQIGVVHFLLGHAAYTVY